MRVFSIVMLVLAGCSQKLQTPDTDQSDTDTDTDTDTDSDTDADTDDTDVDPIWDAATIPEIQRADIAAGAEVEVTDAVITAVGEYGMFASTAEGGEYSGIWVYMGKSGSSWTSSDYHRGDAVTIKAEVREYEDAAYPGSTLTELFVKYSRGDGVTIAGAGTEPKAAEVAASDLTDRTKAERWESVLVKVTDATVDSYDDAFGSWTLDEIPVGTTFYTRHDVYPGDTFTSATGVVNYVFGAFRLEPREAADLVGYSSVIVRAGDVLPGELVVTEIMADPGQSGCEPESEGEYIELYNASKSAIDIAGLDISDTTRTEKIFGRAVVLPGEYALGVAFPTSSWCHPTVTPAFEYDLNWNNDGDVLTLMNATTIDAVNFEDWAFGMPPVGAGMSLDLGLDATANDLEASWCASTTEIDTTGGDKGTPGKANEGCAK